MRQNKTAAFIGLILLLQIFNVAIAQTEKVKSRLVLEEKKLMRLATVEWPPYNGLLLPQEGLATRTASLAAKAAGYRLLTAFDEWTKSLEKGKSHPGFDGVFSLYYTQEREKTCYLSDSIGTSLVGIASLKNKPINWKVVSDLNKYKLGVVTGYSNGEVFDREVAENRQPIEEGASDAVNVEKLMAGKISGIVIDRNVLRYTLSRRGSGSQVIFNPTPLTEASIHICFKRTPQGKTIRDDFNQGLKTLDLKKVESDYINLFKYD